MGFISTVYKFDGRGSELSKSCMKKILKATKLLQVSVGDDFTDDHIICINFTVSLLIDNKKSIFKLSDWWCGVSGTGVYHKAEAGIGMDNLLEEIKKSIRQTLEDE